jgi:hypothetical protein
MSREGRPYCTAVAVHNGMAPNTTPHDKHSNIKHMLMSTTTNGRYIPQSLSEQHAYPNPT